MEASLACESEIVFILFGDVITIADIVLSVKKAGKLAFVHLDLVEGLASRDVAVDYIAKNTRADGVISTKTGIIRRAKALGLLAVQRFFVLDSLAIVNIKNQIPFECVDAIEILPGVIPSIIKTVVGFAGKPVIASGLIKCKEDIMSALGAGAVSVSSTNSEVWSL